MSAPRITAEQLHDAAPAFIIEAMNEFDRAGGDDEMGVWREFADALAKSATNANREHGPPQPGVGARPDGVPALVVRWPAGPGAQQKAWEPPRVAANVAERAAKLRAIGNAVSPIQAYHVGLWATKVLRAASLYVKRRNH